MGNVDFDVDEDVETGDGGGIDGDKAAVAVVDEEVGGERNGGEVVDTTSAVGDVTEDVAAVDGGEGSEDVGEREGVHEEALGELKGNALGASGKNAPNAFVDLEVVVVRENGDGGVEGRVVEDGIGDLVLHKPLRRWLWLSLLHLHRPINLLPSLIFCKPFFFFRNSLGPLLLSSLKGAHVQPAQRRQKRNTSTENRLENGFGVGWGEAEGGGREREESIGMRG